jgi:hypothetical protein
MRIDHLLQNKQFPNCRLAWEFEVAPRTIKRNIDSVRLKNALERIP